MTLEASLQRVAAYANKVLTRKKDSSNMYAGIATAAVLAERMTFKQATEILQLCQEANPNNSKVQYNLALLEYFKGSYEKSFTILESFMKKNPGVFNEEVIILFAINNLMLKNPKDAQRQFQRMMLMYPHKHEYLFNLAMFMHVRLRTHRQDYVMNSSKLNKRDPQQIQLTQTFLHLSDKFLRWLDDTLRTLYGEKLRYPDSYSEEKKHRQLYKYNGIIKTIRESLFYLDKNQQSFLQKIEEDKKQFDAEHKTVQERRRVYEDLEARKKEEIEWEERVRLQREKELEDNAKMNLELANKIHLERLIERKELEAKKKGTKKRKEYEDENGQLPTLNFGKHADDNEHEHEGGFGAGLSFSKNEGRGLKESATKKKPVRSTRNPQAVAPEDQSGTKPEGRSRLKKQKPKISNPDNSDEMLEMNDDSSDGEHDFLPPEDEEDEPATKKKQKPKARPQADEADNNLGDPNTMNFGGDDDEENQV